MILRRVAVLPGEDAAAEALEAAVEVIDALDTGIVWSRPVVGAAALALGESPFPDAARKAIDAADATFFGATSGPSSRALFHLRWGRQTFANVRPTRWLPGFETPLKTPQGVDFVIVRENLEDLYVLLEGDAADLAPLHLKSPTARKPAEDFSPGRYAIKLITECGAEKVIRFAFELATRRKQGGHPGRLTVTAKSNMLPRTDGLFVDVGQRLATAYPTVELETMIIDDFAHRLVRSPQRFDVVVMPNLYGDILSDAAASLAGGLGVAASGCYGEDYAYFEAVHGTAPDIAGKGIVNPTATLLSGAMMLDYLGLDAAGARLRRAIEQVYAEGRTLPHDQGGTATTRSFCAAVVEACAGIS